MSNAKKAYWHEHTQSELGNILPQLEVVLVPTGSIEIHVTHVGIAHVMDELAGIFFKMDPSEPNAFDLASHFDI